MSDPYKQFDRNARRTAPRALLWGVVLVVVILAISLVVIGFRYLSADFRGAASQREKTVASGDYRIASYDAFFDLCNQVVAKEAIIKNFEQQLERAKSPEERQRAQVNLDANVNSRIELVQQYNSDAQKAGTRALFMSDDLPYQINLTSMETKCAA